MAKLEASGKHLFVLSKNHHFKELLLLPPGNITLFYHPLKLR